MEYYKGPSALRIFSPVYKENVIIPTFADNLVRLWRRVETIAQKIYPHRTLR